MENLINQYVGDPKFMDETMDLPGEIEDRDPASLMEDDGRSDLDEMSFCGDTGFEDYEPNPYDGTYSEE